MGFWPSGAIFRGTGNRLKIGVEIRSPGHAGLYLPGGPPALRTASPTLQKGGKQIGGTPLRARGTVADMNICENM